MTGKPLPEFKFNDLDNNSYDSLTLSGKVVVIKCWFAACKPCIEEMPRLNEIRQQYINRNDLVFTSLAFDAPERIRQVLKLVKFDFSVIPHAEYYLQHVLGLKGYPTHIVIGKDGRVSIVTNNLEEMIVNLEAELKKEP
jgi:thiol-disulfide isomerase/thioredoxin